MVDRIDQKIVSGFEKVQDRGIVTGMYAFNETSGKLNRCNIDDNGDFKVNIHSTAGGGDMKARTDIADPATSTFVKCNADGTLEMTAELSSAGLATSAIQTDGTQKTQILGNTEGDGSGTSKHIHTDATGNVLTSIVSSVNVLPANTVNSGITNDPTDSVAVGLRGRTSINDASTETFLKCDTDGHLQIDTAGTLTITGDTQIKAEDDSASARNIRCNNSGHVKSQLIGNTVGDGSGTNKVVQVNDAGQLKTKLIAEDNTATRREVRCNNVGHLQTALLGNTAGDGSGTIKNVVTNTDGNLVVKADVTNTSIATTTAKTTTAVSLYSGGSVTIGTSSTQDFVNGTIGSGTFTQLDVNGLGDVQYLVEGSGTSPSLTIHELVGSTASLGFVSQTQGFVDSEDFAVSLVDSKAQHRGLRIKNNSGVNSYTISSITALYHA